MKLQSSIEYLMTYGWALIIIAIALAALYTLGVFNPPSLANPVCLLPAGLSCANYFLMPDGTLTLNLVQTTSSQINVTGVACNAMNSLTGMTPFQVSIPPGGNATFSVPCWTGYSNNPGYAFQGYLIVNYTNTYTGFPHSVFGKLLVKVS
ncbi:Uncharacterised protein [uncultured archaeon]|nr:Uncharacterised protein [uncultured archaeon]